MASPESPGTTRECCVCLGPITDPCTAPCQHVFCRRCILDVLEAKPPEWSGLCPLCRVHLSVYNLRDATGTFLATPKVHTPFGCIFVQSGCLGLASYHFDAEDDCYISYSNVPDTWRLSDGSPPPSKKTWAEARYDPKTYTFHGVIEWDPPFGSDVRWDYEIVFLEDFTAIVGGRVLSTSSGGSTTTISYNSPWEDNWEQSLAYVRWTPPPSTIFGSVYVQGLSYAPFLEGIASYHFDSEDDCYISYTNAPDDWQLADGSRPPVKKHFVDISFDTSTRTFRGVVEWDPPFGGDVRWEYEMVFSEDFGSICGGQMQPYAALSRSGRLLRGALLFWLPYRPDMTARPVHRYGDPADGDRVPNKMYYVRKPGVLASRFVDLAL